MTLWDTELVTKMLLNLKYVTEDFESVTFSNDWIINDQLCCNYIGL